MKSPVAHSSSLHLLTAIVVVASANACVAERPLDGAYRETAFAEEVDGVEEFDVGTGNYDVLSSTIRGKMGAVAIDHDATPTGYDEEGLTTIYNNVDGADGGAAMTIVDIMGGIAHPDFVPGARLTYASSALADTREGDSFVSVIGCSGPTAGAWDFDSGADSVVVDIGESDVPGHVELTYTAQFTGIESSIVTGSLTVPR